jgi:hypothetical protein
MKLPAFLRRPKPEPGGGPCAEIVRFDAHRRPNRAERPPPVLFSLTEEQAGIDHHPDHVAALRQLT